MNFTCRDFYLYINFSDTDIFNLVCIVVVPNTPTVMYIMLSLIPRPSPRFSIRIPGRAWGQGYKHVWYYWKYICCIKLLLCPVLQLDIALAFHRREPDPFTPVKLIIIIESPIGLINLKEICQFGTSSAKHFTLVAVTFGSDDFLARLGIYIHV